ncbi:MAG: beta-lactamase family protein [Archangium sp.]|nr:beta-lactamase family protein [Archangium sp.]
MTRAAVLLHEGVASRVFQHARAVVMHRGKTVFDDGTTSAGAKFDLASVTKVMSTTALLCRLGVSPQVRVGEAFPEAASAHLTVADLAFHRSGLPAFVPFFAHREPALAAALRVAPVAPPKTTAVYSDIGFILLGAMLEKLHGAPLDALFQRHVAEPFGLTASHFRRVSTSKPDPLVVSTGGTRPREPAPGQEGLWSVTSGPSSDGDVDDDNAYVLDGVAGHAGLFATAADVARFGQAVLEGRIASPVGWERDGSTPGSTRAFGFDTPSVDAPSCGPRFGPRAIGHLGFTGTSLWIDFDRELVVALLTNRVIFGRANVQIRAFRPRFHEAVLDDLGL